jgi:hypothetical protein
MWVVVYHSFRCNSTAEKEELTMTTIDEAASCRGSLLSRNRKIRREGQHNAVLYTMMMPFRLARRTALLRRHASTAALLAKTATDSWIQQYVIGFNLCPFAKKSAYNVEVFESEGGATSQSEIVDFIQEKVHELSSLDSSSSDSRPNLMLVFPTIPEFVDYTHFMQFYDSLEYWQLEDADLKYNPDSMDAKVFLFDFHPQADMRFKTPFPTLHLIRSCDLDAARMGGIKVSQRISDNNKVIIAEHADALLETRDQCLADFQAALKEI